MLPVLRSYYQNKVSKTVAQVTELLPILRGLLSQQSVTECHTDYRVVANSAELLSQRVIDCSTGYRVVASSAELLACLVIRMMAYPLKALIKKWS